ncbi:hypothetical protein C8F01DRAFT_1163647 [Mycena amicta]|nr:hypothetical protein C8F01DRAFT_1163647 [Mycena amicta]
MESRSLGSKPALQLLDVSEDHIMSKIAGLEDEDLSAALLALLTSLLPRPFTSTQEKLEQQIIHRISSVDGKSPLIPAINTFLMTPASTASATRLQATLFGWAGILTSLPISRLSAFRSGLARLANEPTLAERQHPMELQSTSRRLVEYIDKPLPWVPVSKFDWLGLRSLDKVTTADTMAPFVDGLLEWLQDSNWPVSGGCEAHLARFPELCVDPIRAVLRRGDDGDWESRLLSFVSFSVPGKLRERMRPELERIAQRPTQGEQDCDVWAAAMELLEEMDGPRRGNTKWTEARVKT